MGSKNDCLYAAGSRTPYLGEDQVPCKLNRSRVKNQRLKERERELRERKKRDRDRERERERERDGKGKTEDTVTKREQERNPENKRSTECGFIIRVAKNQPTCSYS